MLASHDRFDYSPITDRPDFSWPAGKRLAVYVAVALEHFPYNTGGLGIAYSPGLQHPNTYNWAWREYGNRVGGFRLLDLLMAFQIRPTVLANGECFGHCPQLMAAYRDADAEFVAHGMTNAQQPNGLEEPEEREMIGRVRQIIEREAGAPPAGWMSPGANPSARTEDLLAEQGFSYTLDWPVDDQPVWMRTAGGPLLAVPYPHEVNDVPAIVFHDLPGRDFAEMVQDNVAEMLEQSQRQSLVCGVVIHSFIVGQPYRLRRLRDALRQVAAGSDDIWFATPGDVAHYFRTEVAPPRATTTQVA
ncbi:MAG: polysaccharide deacetylase family protein [Solirubrobacterales bacterium]|nr:polysaccharide deacetylase family protein [Solirubrobacterales bacterium]